MENSITEAQVRKDSFAVDMFCCLVWFGLEKDLSPETCVYKADSS